MLGAVLLPVMAGVCTCDPLDLYPGVTHCVSLNGYNRRSLLYREHLGCAPFWDAMFLSLTVCSCSFVQGHLLAAF